MKETPRIKLLYLATFPPPEGGQRLIFHYLYQDLLNRYQDQLDIRKVDLSAKTARRFYILYLVWRFLKGLVAIPRSDVVLFQAPYNYIHFMGPFYYLMCRAMGKPLITRRSAGNNIELFQKQPRWFQKLLVATILNADLSCFETHYEVEFFQKLSRHRVRFISNNRPLFPLEWNPVDHVPKHFIFLGNLNREKGVQHLLSVFPKLAQKYEIQLTLYGKDQIRIESQKLPGIQYGGLLPHEEIPRVLANADVLVLPSYREGIPGVIIEAFMLNKPVIATNLPSIQQIVKDRSTGILIPPGDEEQLASAIEEIHTNLELYNQLSKNISTFKHQLSTEYWTDILVQEIKALVKR